MRLKIKLNHNKSNQMLVFGGGKIRSSPAKPSHNRLENLQTQCAYEGGSGNPKRHNWWNASLVTTAPTLLSIFKTSELLFSGSPQHPNQLDSPLAFPFDSYLKKEPLVGLTKHATDTSFEETNGLGTRKGGIINEQRLRDLPQIGQVSGKLEKNIFH